MQTHIQSSFMLSYGIQPPVPICLSPLTICQIHFFITVHIKECPCNGASHTAWNRGLFSRQPCLFQISQLFHTSPFINSQVSLQHMHVFPIRHTAGDVQRYCFILRQDYPQRDSQVVKSFASGNTCANWRKVYF